MHMRKRKRVTRLNKEDLHNHQGFSYKNFINCVKFMKTNLSDRFLYRSHSTNPSYCDMPKSPVGKYKTAKHT